MSKSLFPNKPKQGGNYMTCEENFLVEVGFIIGTLETKPMRDVTIKIVKRILIKWYQTLTATKRKMYMESVDDLKVRLNNIETIDKKVNARISKFEEEFDMLKAVFKVRDSL